MNVFHTLFDVIQNANQSLYSICSKELLVEGENGLFEANTIYDCLTGYSIIETSTNNVLAVKTNNIYINSNMDDDWGEIPSFMKNHKSNNDNNE